MVAAGTTILLFLLAGCASRDVLPTWDPAAMTASARAIEADSMLLDDEELLLEAALAHLHPAGPAHDPGRAAILLERLRERSPDHQQSVVLSYLLPLAREAQRAGEEIEQQRALLEELRASIQDYREVAAMADDARASSEARLAELIATVERLQEVVAARDARLREIEEQLRGLMEIDLADPPR